MMTRVTSFLQGEQRKAWPMEEDGASGGGGEMWSQGKAWYGDFVNGVHALPSGSLSAMLGGTGKGYTPSF